MLFFIFSFLRQSFFFFCCFLFLAQGKTSESYSIPGTLYGPCHWASELYTENLVNQSWMFSSQIEESLGDLEEERKPTNIHDACFLASGVRGDQIWEPTSPVSPSRAHYYYCRSSDGIPESYMEVEDSHGQLRQVFPRSFCLNKNYIELTSNAFHQMARCFEFDAEGYRQLFALFNHESAFILNKRSHTGASCYGQLTSHAIDLINKVIFFRGIKQSFASYSAIYDDVVRKCPSLADKVAPSEILTLEREERTTKAFEGIMRDFVKERRHICYGSHDPYFCLFYSMYTVKINLLRAGMMINRASEKTEEGGDAIGSIANFFPITANEVLVINGLLTRRETQETEERNWIFTSDKEAIVTLRKHSYDLNDLEIKKVNLFDDGENFSFKWALAHFIYNGGYRGIGLSFRNFITSFKKKIGEPCSRLTEEMCSYRFALLEQKSPLDFEVFKLYFKDHLQHHYNSRKQRRRREVANFLDKIQDHMAYFLNRNGLLRSYLQAAFLPENDNFQINEITESNFPEMNQLLYLKDFVRDSCHLSF